MVTADGLLIAAIETSLPDVIVRSGIDRLHERLGAEADREHAAQSAGALLQATSVIDHVNRLLEGEDTGEIMCGHFAGTVADHRVGVDAELLEAARRVLSGWRSWRVARPLFRPCEIGLHRREVRRSETSWCNGSARDRCAGCSR